MTSPEKAYIRVHVLACESPGDGVAAPGWCARAYWSDTGRPLHLVTATKYGSSTVESDRLERLCTHAEATSNAAELGRWLRDVFTSHDVRVFS